MDSVTLTIDGRQVTVPQGTTVLQAAIQAGIQVPYYCYHPGLGIDGSCRVCIVKIEKMPNIGAPRGDAGEDPRGNAQQHVEALDDDALHGESPARGE